MNTLLYQVVSGIVAALIVIAWTRPGTFVFLRDKGTDFPSLSRLGQYTALLVSTWVMATMALKGEVQEWLFIGYMLAWAGAQFGSLYLKSKGQGGVTTTETRSSVATTVTPAPLNPNKGESV